MIISTPLIVPREPAASPSMLALRESVREQSALAGVVEEMRGRLTAAEHELELHRSMHPLAATVLRGSASGLPRITPVAQPVCHTLEKTLGSSWRGPA